MVERVRINYRATGVLDLSDASARSTRDLSTSGHAHPPTASVACHCSVSILSSRSRNLLSRIVSFCRANCWQQLLAAIAGSNCRQQFTEQAFFPNCRLKLSPNFQIVT
jgi:hypothetical protein